MSDFDDDLLALAEGTSVKKSKKPKKGKKSRNAEDLSSASDMDMSADDSDSPPPKSRAGQTRPSSAQQASEDEEDDSEDDELVVASKYPLEGIYIDEADRRRIQAMTELDREAILGERADEIAKEQSRRELRRMVREKERAENARKGISTSRAGRERKTTGATKEKAEGIERLRRSRQEKGKRVQARKLSDDEYEDDSPRKAKKSRLNYSDDSDDDYNDSGKRSSKKVVAEPAGPTLFRDITIPRSRLVQFMMAPWFEAWATGAWVRLMVGTDGNEPKYRLSQIIGVRDSPREPYQVEGTRATIQLQLKIGSVSKFWKLEAISNSPPAEKEYASLVRRLEDEKIPMPSAKEAESIKKRLEERTEYVMTEADLAAALAKRGPRANSAQSRAKLLMERDFARSAGDQDKVAELERRIAEFDKHGSQGSKAEESDADRLKRVNERNRALNREEVAKAEARYQEERRKQAAALARGDSNVKLDPSARVKTMARLKYDRETPSTSRQGTPGPVATIDEKPNGSTLPASPTTSQSRANKLDQSLAKHVEVNIDLDF